MEIIVQGKGVEYFAPNEVVLNINFNTKCLTYEEALREGTKNVQHFIDELLIKNGFQKEDMKTRNFVIREETKYNNITKDYNHDGYSFNQTASLRFDYDKELMAKMMVAISRLENAPICQIQFEVKDAKECKRRILAKAYKDAEVQALAIAEASGKTLKYCQKVDFKPFTTEYVSKASFGSDMMFAEKAMRGSADIIVNTFTPEDVELSETLYCLWIAE